eukprot:TRINITY_DN1371_c0_g1_i1.p1 TRINITY_DN1371_c0_g1~~TRINITY_DN1371_c0_g1_i1.p1  ORF type:complete len:303 (-),score=68.38 TRINITY_DN1371_c0_g1_i1:79-987(-)
MTWSWVNGKLTENPKCSFKDFGLFYGTGCYEVIPVFNGRLFKSFGHLSKFRYSCERLGLDHVPSLSELEKAVDSLLLRNCIVNGIVTMLATPGNCSKGYWEIPNRFSANYFIATEVHSPLETKEIKPITCILCPDSRGYHSQIRSTSLLPSLLLLKQAIHEGYDDVIYYDRHNEYVFESSHSSVFLIEGNYLVTPPIGPKVFDSVIRQEIISIAGKLGYFVRIKDFITERFRRADGVFLADDQFMLRRVIKIGSEKLPDNCTVFDIIQNELNSVIEQECTDSLDTSIGGVGSFETTEAILCE